MPAKNLAVENGHINEEEKKSPKANPWVRKINPTMIENPYPLDFLDGMDSYSFVREKTRRELIGPGGFRNQRDWIEFAKQAWIWAETMSNREAWHEVDGLISSLENLLAKVEPNSELAQRAKDRIEALV